MTVGQDLCIRTCNAGACDLFGSTEAALAGQPASVLLHGDSAAELRAMIDAVSRGATAQSQSGADAERILTGAHSNGTLFPVALEVNRDPVGKGVSIRFTRRAYRTGWITYTTNLTARAAPALTLTCSPSSLPPAAW